MKNLIVVILIVIPFILKAQVKQQIIKVDTVPGHGYEIMYVGKHVTSLNSDAGSRAVDYYQPRQYDWPKAKIKIDSIYNLNQGWRLVSTSQLKKIFEITQPIMDQKRIRIGNSNFEGIHGLYWCNNSPDGSFDDLDNLDVAGSQNNKNFEVTEHQCSETVRVTSDGKNLIYSEQLLMVRKY